MTDIQYILNTFLLLFSGLGIISGFPISSNVANAEYVVPKSMPITFFTNNILFYFFSFA